MNHFETEITEPPRDPTPVVEEFYWMTYNKKFQKDVTEFRKKWCVTKKNKVAGLRHLKDKKEVQDLLENTQMILKRCKKIHNTHRVLEFTPILNNYLYHGKLDVYYKNPPRGVPNVFLKLDPTKKFFQLEGKLSIDTTASDLKIMSRRLLAEIKGIQKKLKVQKKLRVSKGKSNFLLNAKFFSKYNEFCVKKAKKPIKKIYDSLSDSEMYTANAEVAFSAGAISKRICDLKKKISESYSYPS